MRPRARSFRICEEPAFRRYWYPIARLDALPARRRLLGVDVTIEPQPDGSVTTVRRADRSAVSTASRYGWVWICLDAPAVLPLPEIDEFERDGWRVVPEPESEWSCPAPMLIENNLDPAHIAYVHRGSFGTPEHPDVPIAEVERTSTGLRTFYEVGVQARPGEDRPTVRRTISEVHGPLLAVIRIDYPDGVCHLMVKACSPIDDTHTRQLQTVLRNDTESDRPAADIEAFDAAVWDEDRYVLESAHHDYPLDLTAQVHIKSDRPMIEYRRLMGEIAAAASVAGP